MKAKGLVPSSLGQARHEHRPGKSGNMVNSPETAGQSDDPLGRPFRALFPRPRVSWGVAPGWDEDGPLALQAISLAWKVFCNAPKAESESIMKEVYS